MAIIRKIIFLYYANDLLPEINIGKCKDIGG
jgi:hypothetical protein